MGACVREKKGEGEVERGRKRVRVPFGPFVFN